VVRTRFTVGDQVHTPFGKGVVKEVRNAGRLQVEVNGRALVLADTNVSKVESSRQRPRSAGRQEQELDRSPALAPQRRVPGEIDLHGCTVEEALARVEDALNEALLADVPQLRFIHGRSGGRIRAALHQRLREIRSVRHFLIDPRNDGVTIVEL
jgi:DNA mismatch repair protein MutS2